MSLGVDVERVTAELRALAHPLRLRILSLLTGAAMTAAEIARELGLTHANASYHLRQLHAVGQIEIAGEERIRGGAAKRYRHRVERPIEWAGTEISADLSPQQQALFAALAQELARRTRQLRFSPGRQHLTDAELWVTPELWHEVRDLVMAASMRLHHGAQPHRTPGTIRTNATFAMFEMQSIEGTA